MTKRVLVHVDSLRRDGATAAVLAELLKRRGYRAIASGQLTTPFYLKHWRPDLLFHTSTLKIDHYLKHGVIKPDDRPRIFLLPQEGRVTDPEVLAMVYGGRPGVLRDCIDRMYLWNRPNRDWLVANTPIDPDNLRLVGAYRLDLVKYGRAPDLTARPPVVGLIGRFPPMNSPEHRSMGYYMVAKLAPPERRSGHLEMIKRAAGALSWYGDIIRGLIARTDYKISVRPHHNESPQGDAYRWLKAEYGNRIEIDGSLSFYDWAVDKSVLITTTSSTVAEVYLARTPVVCIDRMAGLVDEMPAWWRDLYEGYGLDACPASFDDLIAAVGHVVENFEPARQNAFLDDMLARDSLWPAQGSCLSAIAGDIDENLGGAGGPGRRPRIPGASVFGHGWYLAKVLNARLRERTRAHLHYHYDGWVHGCPAYLRAVIDRIEKDRPRRFPEIHPGAAEAAKLAAAE